MLSTFNFISRLIGYSALSCYAGYYSYSLYNKYQLGLRRSKLNKKEEKVVIIGATSGIGLELALLYASRGAEIVLVGRRKSLLEGFQLKCQQSSLSAKIHVYAYDVTEFDKLPQFQKWLEMKLTRIDTLILNAGILSTTQFEPWVCSSDSFSDSYSKLDKLCVLDQVLDINYRAPMYLTAYLLPLLRQSGYGNIVVTSSLAGTVPAPTRAAYCGSKHAIQGFFSSLRTELSLTSNIQVCLVCPGSVSTDLRSKAPDATIASSPNSKALSSESVANSIQKASDLSVPLIFLPTSGYFATLAFHLVPSLIEFIAKKKYNV